MGAFLADHVIAIEPNSEAIHLLRRNLSANIDNFSIYDCALDEKDGLGKIVIPEKANNNLGMAQVVPDSNNGDIKTTTLDSIINFWQQEQDEPFNVSLIKIDVEGMELAVLKGATNTITQYWPHIFAEAATDKEFHKINDYLHGFGYKKLSRWAATPVYHFAHKPSLSLILKSRWFKILKKMREFKLRLIRLQGSHPATKIDSIQK